MAEPNIHKLRLRTLKHDRTYAIFDENGDIAAENGVQGVYIDDMRYQSALTLKLGGSRPESVGAQVTPDNAEMIVRLANPIMQDAGGKAIPENTIQVERRITVCDGLVHQAVKIVNRGREPVALPLTFEFASDFSDMFEVRGMKAEKPLGNMRQISIADEFAQVRWNYRASDKKERNGNIFFGSDPKPDSIGTGSASYVLDLEPGEEKTLYLEFGNHKDNAIGPRQKSYDDALAVVRGERERFIGQGTRISFSNRRLQKWFDRSREDLALLINHYDSGPYPCAGLPWFATPFGRDGIITAMQTLWTDPDLARGVLKFLSARQATAEDPARDAEPGKIMHETRQNEASRQGLVPFELYYGGVDTTLLYVMLAGEYLKRTGDRAFIDEIWPNIEAALGWIENYAEDANYDAVAEKDGFLVYQKKAETGLLNQMWKDSVDSVFYENGDTNVKFPRAVCEIQGYAYAAWRVGQQFAAARGLADKAAYYGAKADRLKERFNEKFWDEEKGGYILALDGDKKPCRVMASNMGQLLFTGIVPPGRQAAVAAHMTGERFFSGYGIRTVAEGEPNFNPLVYHNGTVWPHDTALIARGLGETGDSAAVAKIMKGLLDAAEHYNWRLPELFAGFSREADLGPTSFTHACSPQAWAAAVPFQMAQAVFDLDIDAARKEIRLNPNAWPAELGAVTIENLPVGDKRVSFAILPDNNGRAFFQMLSAGTGVAAVLTGRGRQAGKENEFVSPTVHI